MKQLRAIIPSALLILALLLVRPLGLTWLHLPLAIAVLLVPGYLLVRLAGLPGAGPAERAALTGVAGFLWLCVVGVAAAVILPWFGVDRPLAGPPLLGAYSAGLAALTWIAARRPALMSAPRVRLHSVSLCMYVLAGALPLMSFVGAALLNNGKSNALLIAMFLAAVAGIVTAIIRRRELHAAVFPVLLYSISLSVLWTYTARSGFVYGGDIQESFRAFQATAGAGIWQVGAAHNPYGALLSLTVFPAVVSDLSGLSGLAVFKVLFPMVCSLLPVVLYYTYRVFAGRWVAFAAAALTIAQYYYVQEFPALSRQHIALLFLAVLLYVLVHTSWAAGVRRWLLVVSACGLVVSDQGTACVVAAVLLIWYAVTKAARLALRQDLSFVQIMRRDVFMYWWLVPLLVAGMIVWYGPVTHSNRIAESIVQPGSYAAFLDEAVAFLQRDVVFAVKTEQPPATAEQYLATIGGDYYAERPFLKYYPLASNAGLREEESPVIPPAPGVYPLSTTTDSVVRFGGWALALAGALAVAVRAWRVRTARQAELAVVAVTVPLLAIAVYGLPQSMQPYSVSYITQLLWLIGVLPAMVAVAWLLGRTMPVWRPLAVAGFVSLSLLFSGGVMTQMAGGVPTANLTNYGSNYQRLYQHETDRAAAAWLGDVRLPGDAVFADPHASLRLTTEIDVHRNFFRDVTPETVNVDAFVFADRTNVVDRTTTAVYQGKIVQFTFPEEFLAGRKDLLYNNGQAKVYR